jgi:hypothetical protein
MLPACPKDSILAHPFLDFSKNAMESKGKFWRDKTQNRREVVFSEVAD